MMRVFRRPAPASLVTLLGALALGGVALAASPGVRARGWAPLVRLVGGSGPAARAMAVERLREASRTVHALLHGLDADEATRAFFAKVIDQLESFDLAALYETLPEEEPGGWRRVRFTGAPQGPRYVVQRAGKDESCACDPDGKLGSHFGDLAVSFRSKKAPGEGNDDYVGNSRMDLGVGGVSWPQLLGSIAELVKLTESGAPGAPRVAPELRPAAATLVEVKKDNPRLGPEDLELMGVFRESFPRLYEHLRELYETQDILVYDPDQEDFRQVHLVLGLRDSAKESHPAIHEWLTGMGPLATGRLEVTDSQGRALVTLRFSTKDLTLTVDTFLCKGKLCPVEAGRVLVDEGTDVEAVARSHHRDRWTFGMDVNGITTEISDLAFDVDYERTKEGMKATMALHEEPRVRVHGSAFGLIPTWAIDVVVPGNLEELTKAFLRVLTRGNGGKGFVLTASWREGKQGSNVFSMEGEGEALDNFLVRLGFKVARRKILPSEAAVDDLADYFRRGNEAFAKDLEAFAGEK